MSERRHDQLLAADDAYVGIEGAGRGGQFALLDLDGDRRLRDGVDPQAPVKNEVVVIHLYLSSVDGDLGETQRSRGYAVGDDSYIGDLGDRQLIKKWKGADVDGHVLGAGRGADALCHLVLSPRAKPQIRHHQPGHQQDQDSRHESKKQARQRHRARLSYLASGKASALPSGR